VAAVHAFDGTVVQFMGDGMMALFGAPNRLPQPAQAGFAAA
jgi:class 3 adenylate cyclase